MPHHDSDERYEFERAVEDVRRFASPLYEALLKAVGQIAKEETAALVAAVPDAILVQQGRAQMMRDLHARIINASDRLNEAAARRARAVPGKPGTP